MIRGDRKPRGAERRRCLRCEKRFRSEGIFHRLCAGCRKAALSLEAVAIRRALR